MTFPCMTYEMENNKCSSHHQPVILSLFHPLKKWPNNSMSFLTWMIPTVSLDALIKVGFDHHHFPLVNVYIHNYGKIHHENSWVNQLFYMCTHHHDVPNIAGCPIFLLPKTIIRFPWSKKRPAQLGRWLRVPSYNLGKHDIVWCIPISFPL